MTDRQVNVRGIIFKDGKLLAQQLTPNFDGVERNFWCTPGGGLEKNESLEKGLVREIIEETGIVPKIGKLLFVEQFHDKKGFENLEFFFHIENVDDFEAIDLSKTSHGELEIKKTEFIDPKSRFALPTFLQTIDIQEYITNDKPVFIDNDLEYYTS